MIDQRMSRTMAMTLESVEELQSIAARATGQMSENLRVLAQPGIRRAMEQVADVSQVATRAARWSYIEPPTIPELDSLDVLARVDLAPIARLAELQVDLERMSAPLLSAQTMLVDVHLEDLTEMMESLADMLRAEVVIPETLRLQHAIEIPSLTVNANDFTDGLPTFPDNPDGDWSSVDEWKVQLFVTLLIMLQYGVPRLSPEATANLVRWMIDVVRELLL